jgi:hypothetical protein
MGVGGCGLTHAARVVEFTLGGLLQGILICFAPSRPRINRPWIGEVHMNVGDLHEGYRGGEDIMLCGGADCRGKDERIDDVAEGGVGDVKVEEDFRAVVAHHAIDEALSQAGGGALQQAHS